MSLETEQIKERINIADVVSEHVKLKQAGQSMKGLCPFHAEKTPSFIVTPRRGSWHCFGCFPPGQKVKTPFGFHDIESIGTDHYVVSGAGEIRKVLTPIERQYEGDLVTIRLRKLTYPVSLTADHNVFVVRGAPSTKSYKTFARRYRNYLEHYNQGDKEKYSQKVSRYFPIQKVPAGTITKGDLLLYPIDKVVEDIQEINLADYGDPRSNMGPKPAIIPYKIPVDENFLRLCGYYIAEGSNHRAYIRFSLGNHEEQFAQDIVTLIKDIFGLSAAIYRRPSSERTGIEVTACHAPLAAMFSNFMGKGAANKHIPFIFQRLPIEKQRILLDAIYRGDGTAFFANKSSRIHKSITTISRVLAEQVSDILLRSSIFPTVNVRISTDDALGVHHRESYTIEWGDESASRYNVIYYFEGATYWVLPILSIGKTNYKGPVYNLNVDRDHSYVTSSFAVSNCGEGGDVFSFVQKIEGIDFPTALKLLADRAGVKLPQRRPQVESHRQRLFDLLAATARFYHEILMNQKAGERAKTYVAGRGITEKTMEEFIIGYSPHAWDTLSTWLRKKGYSEEEMVASGTVGKADSGKLFDRFRGRVIFPVLDLQGRVVAFGGRIVPWHETGNEGKYVNSPETMLYEKRRTVYNLSRAKKALRGGQACIVVEGYMDVVMLVQSGIEHVVATSGTALTEDHVDILKRFTNNLHFAFDGDNAGWKATIAATQSALASGMNVDTIMMPNEKDPADIAKENPAGLQEIFQNTKPLMEVLVGRIGVGDSASREQALHALLPLLRLVKNPIMQGGMVEQVARLLRTPETQIINLLSQGEAAPAFLPPPIPESSSAGSSALSAEYQLLGLLLAYPSFAQEALEDIREEFFLDQNALEVYNDIKRKYTSQEDISEKYMSFCIAIESRMEEQMKTSSFSPQEEIRAIIRLLKKRLLVKELKELQLRPQEFQAALAKLAAIDA